MLKLLSCLKAPVGANKKKKRLGRGDASGHGGTSTKGHKGQRSRSGGYHKVGFEGGQTPLYRRLPKRGFFNPFREAYQIVNLKDLEKIETEGVVVDPAYFYEKGLIRSLSDKVKVLASGDFSKKIVIKAHAFSKQAAAKIQQLGGQTEVLGR